MDFKEEDYILSPDFKVVTEEELYQIPLGPGRYGVGIDEFQEFVVIGRMSEFSPVIEVLFALKNRPNLVYELDRAIQNAEPLDHKFFN